jgi:hypothetical protein
VDAAEDVPVPAWLNA